MPSWSGRREFYFSIYLNDRMGGRELDSSGSGQGQVLATGPPSGSIKWEFLDWRTVSFSKTLLHSVELVGWLIGYPKVNVQFERETCSSRYVSTLCTYPCNWRNFNLHWYVIPLFFFFSFQTQLNIHFALKYNIGVLSKLGLCSLYAWLKLTLIYGSYLVTVWRFVSWSSLISVDVSVLT